MRPDHAATAWDPGAVGAVSYGPRMRLLHTSDWHLGRSLHREGMLGHQAAFVDHLLAVVEAEQVDVVLVAGDIYDRALPPVDAVRLADETLARLAASRARVVLTSGNHDSAQRLGFSSRLIDAAGVHIRADLAAVGEPVVISDEHGPVAFHGLPYLEPCATADAWGLDVRRHEAAVGEAMRRVRADLTTRTGTRSVVLAHAFVGGSSTQTADVASDSERDISVGGVSMVPTSAFDGIDYTALGHLHGRRELTPRVRYSGSPLPYSFSEATHLKGSWLVDLAADGTVTAELVEAPVPRRLARLRGSLDALLADPDLAVHEDAWVEATLTDTTRPLHAMEQLRRRFPHTLLLGFSSPPPGLGELGLDRPVGRTRSDRDVAGDFLTAMRGETPDAEELALLHDAVDACCEDPEVDTLVRASSSGASGGDVP